MTEPTSAQLDKLSRHHWRMHMALDTDDGGYIVFRCEELKCSKHIETPRKSKRGPGYAGYLEYGPQRVTYTIDDDDTIYESIRTLISTLIERGII